MAFADLRWEDPFPEESGLLERAAEQLSLLLGEGWKVEQLTDAPREVDAIWRLHPPGSASPATLVVEVKAASLTPRAGHALAAQLERGSALLEPRAAGLAVAPYLSPRTRQVLDDLGVSYMDATGNVSLRLAEPVVVVRTEGAQKDPAPPPDARRGMSGPRAGRLVRELVDRRPPRRGVELSKATGLSESYVSRLLDLLGEEALVRRRQRVVTEVDWSGLLRARASSYDLLKANHVVPTIARQGVARTLDRVRDLGTQSVLVTGSFAANSFAPLVVGGAPMLYVPPDPRSIADLCKQLGLMRIDQLASAEVLLLQPMNHGVFERPFPRLVNGFHLPGLSQVVLDCLAGPGRLPAAGEELISWMEGNEAEWRWPSPLENGEA